MPLSLEEIQLTARREEGFADQVFRLISDPEGYNLSGLLNATLMQALDKLAEHTLELDHIKRALAYGERLRTARPGLAYAHGQRDSSIPGDNALLAHFLLGSITEALELIPFLQKLQTSSLDSADQKELVRELGDGLFYATGAAACLGRSMADVREEVMTKLGKRYQDLQFSADAAVNRNEAAEQ